MSEMKGKMIYQVRRYEIFQARKGLKLFSHRFKLVSSYVPRDIWFMSVSNEKWSIIKHENDNEKK